jgi:hypothetical protein
MALTALMVGGVISRESMKAAMDSSVSHFGNGSVFSDWSATTSEAVGDFGVTPTSQSDVSDVTRSVLQNHHSDDVDMKVSNEIDI